VAVSFVKRNKLDSHITTNLCVQRKSLISEVAAVWATPLKNYLSNKAREVLLAVL
jgi:hypothetical protein